MSHITPRPTSPNNGRWRAVRLARSGLLSALSLLLIALLAACATSSTGGTSATPTASATPVATHTPTPTATATKTPTPAPQQTGYPIKVYFPKTSDPDFSHVFPVNRVSPTSAVGTFAIQLLIAGPTPEERAAGYFSELNGLFTGGSQCGGTGVPTLGGPDFTLTLNMKGNTAEQGTATVKFCRTTASPGIGADARVSAEITTTLRQFSTIKKVVILTVNGQCFGDESGQNLCLK